MTTSNCPAFLPYFSVKIKSHRFVQWLLIINFYLVNKMLALGYVEQYK